MTDLDPPAELAAERLVSVFEGQRAQLLTFLVNQMAAVRSQAQAMMGLCGLIITVTGFSGPRMIVAATFSAYAMVAGILLTLVGAVLSLRVMADIRWVTSVLSDDLVDTTQRILRMRDAQHNRVLVASLFVALGLAAYLVAVAVAAFRGADDL